MQKKFIDCVKEVSKKIKQGKIAKTYKCGKKKKCKTNPYSICRKATGYYGTTHDIGMIHPKRKNRGYIETEGERSQKPWEKY